MESYSDLDALLASCLNDLPLLLEVDEVCWILGISEIELKAMARSGKLDLDEDCVMRDDLKKFLSRKD